MTDISTQRQTFRDAVELLVQRAVAAGNPKSPGAYAASIRADLLNEHRSTAMDLLDVDPSLTAESLAEALQPTPVVEERQGRGPETPYDSWPTYGSEDWARIDAERQAGRERARAGLAAARDALKERTQP